MNSYFLYNHANMIFLCDCITLTLLKCWQMLNVKWTNNHIQHILLLYNSLQYLHYIVQNTVTLVSIAQLHS